MKAEGLAPAAWVTEMIASGNTSFYTVKEGTTHYYNIASKAQVKVPGQDAFIILNNIRETKKVWSNTRSDCSGFGRRHLKL